MKYNNFSILIDKVLIDERLTEKEKIIYLILNRIKSYNPKLNIKQEIIFKAFNISKPTYIKAIDTLEKYNYIKTYKRQRAKDKAVERIINICEVNNNTNLFDFINSKLEKENITNFRFFTSEYKLYNSIEKAKDDNEAIKIIKDMITGN